MLNWLRKLISKTGAKEYPVEAASADFQGEGEPGYTPLRIDQLFVQPDESEDFDREACERLLVKLSQLGATTVDEVYNICVELEDFFDGNRCKHSIAANVAPHPPYDTAAAWYEHLKQIRDLDGIEKVLVAIYMVEPYEDGRVGMWPYADTIWIYSSLNRDAVASLVSPIDPDEVRDASLNDDNYDLKPPLPHTDLVRPYWVWWD